MTAMKPPTGPGREQLIGALVPTPIIGPRPAPAPMTLLPASATSADADPATVVLATARLDGSGRVTVCSLLKALSWRPGRRIDVRVRHGAVVIASTQAGRYVVGGRGEIGLPASARQLCGIVPGSSVQLAALIPSGLLVIHPASTVVRLLHDLHARVTRDHDVS
jgi:bifunctional DNA-binding transcriptional regulator/antitoxin component of YhaV-PrlF toxin-antitoxin module